MKRILIGVLAIMLLGSLKPADYTLLKSIEVKGKYFVTDNLGNSFILSKSNDIDKYDRDGKHIQTQNFKILGSITTMDASNPFELYLFYQAQNKLVFLDNMLSRRGDLDFNQGNFVQLTAAARSYDNGAWIFDLDDLQLKRIDKEFKVLAKSGNVRAFTDVDLSPNFILDYKNSVYLNDPEVGILVFDIFANYSKTLPIKDLTNFQVIDKDLYYFKAGKLHKYSLLTYETEEINLPETADILNVRIEKNRLYVLKDKQLNLYAF